MDVQQLQKILQAIDILSPTAFSFAGQVFNGQMIPPMQLGQAQMQPENMLVGQLQHALYMYTYIQRFDGILSTPPMIQQPSDDLIEVLSQANTSCERWDVGWQIVQVAPSGQVLAHKNSATRSLWPGEFLTQDGPGAPLRVGAMIRIYSPRESKALQSGFYFAFGETASEPQEMYEAVRFYLNSSAESAIELMQQVTHTLNRFKIPFRFKCCTYPVLFYRLDSSVLYVTKRHYRITAELLLDIYRRLQHPLEPETPMFTRRLAPGLAFAEEPGTGESFGMLCCRIVAEGLWSASIQGAQSIQARLNEVKKQFERYGIDFEQPYLRPASIDIYEFPIY